MANGYNVATPSVFRTYAKGLVAVATVVGLVVNQVVGGNYDDVKGVVDVVLGVLGAIGVTAVSNGPKVT